MDVPPQRRKVYNDFHAALSAGRVVKPATCEGCGKSPVGHDVLDAHHDDYSRPLDVRWLCRSCHVRHHDALRAAAGTGRQRADGAAKQPRPITNADGSRAYCQKPMACIAGKRGRCRLCQGNEAAIVAYHDDGKHYLRETAAHFGVTKQHISQVLDRAGVFSRKQPHRRAA